MENHTTAGGACTITIRIVGPPDHEKWYTIWKNAAVLTKVCAYDRNRAGTAFALGENDPCLTPIWAGLS